MFKKKLLEEPEALICFKKEAVTLGVGGTFLKNPELTFFFFLKLLLENTGKDAKEEEEGR